MELTYEVISQEGCNCGDRVMHNNGGNYHAIDRKVTDNQGNEWLEQTDTREDFPGDTYEYWIYTRDGIVNLWGSCAVAFERIDHRLTDSLVAARFRDGEATLVKGKQVGLRSLPPVLKRLMEIEA